MSPGGRDNITFAIDRLEDAAEATYRNGFVDGEKHAAEDSSIQANRLEQLFAPFKAGSDWGYIKALIVNGAPDPAIGRNIAKKITAAQVAVDKYFMERKGNSSFVPVPNRGTFVPSDASILAQNEWLKDRLADLQLPARSHENIEEWLVECGMPASLPHKES